MALDRVVATLAFGATATPSALSINTTGRDFLLVVIVTDDAATTISSINHNGDALTLKQRFVPFSASVNSYFRVAPDQGTLNVNVTLSQEDSGVIYAIAYSGADQSTSLGTAQSAESVSPHNTVGTTLAAASGDECLALYIFNGEATIGSFASGETQIGSPIDSGPRVVLSQKAGAASVSMSLGWSPDSTYNGATWSVPVKVAAGGSSTTVTPSPAALSVSGKQVATSSFQSVRIREVLVNGSGQAVGGATDIGLRVWYSGICAGAPDVSLNGMTTDANGTTSWSIVTGTLAYNQAIFYVAQNSVSYSHYACGRLVPSYE